MGWGKHVNHIQTDVKNANLKLKKHFLRLVYTMRTMAEVVW